MKLPQLKVIGIDMVIDYDNDAIIKDIYSRNNLTEDLHNVNLIHRHQNSKTNHFDTYNRR